MVVYPNIQEFFTSIPPASLNPYCNSSTSKTLKICINYPKSLSFLCKKNQHKQRELPDLQTGALFHVGHKHLKIKLWISIGSLSASKCGDNIDKSSVVLHSSLGTASLGLLLFLFVNLKNITTYTKFELSNRTLKKNPIYYADERHDYSFSYLYENSLVNRNELYDLIYSKTDYLKWKNHL